MDDNARQGSLRSTFGFRLVMVPCCEIGADIWTGCPPVTFS
jgi:hypothetical protein